MFSHLRTMWLVFLHLLHKKDTVQYPEEKNELHPRWRGRIVLTRDPDGGERCVGWYLCAAACPVDCIALQATEDVNRRRYPEFFRINFSRCIFCGACGEDCPPFAIPGGFFYGCGNDLFIAWSPFRIGIGNYYLCRGYHRIVHFCRDDAEPW